MKHGIAIVETEASAEREITAAWHAYQQTAKYGLEFGRVCCTWRDKFSAQGSRTGKGLRPILDKVGIPRSTAYWWMDRYEVSIGIKTEKDVAEEQDKKFIEKVKAHPERFPELELRTAPDPAPEPKPKATKPLDADVCYSKFYCLMVKLFGDAPMEERAKEIRSWAERIIADLGEHLGEGIELRDRVRRHMKNLEGVPEGLRHYRESRGHRVKRMTRDRRGSAAMKAIIWEHEKDNPSTVKLYKLGYKYKGETIMGPRSEPYIKRFPRHEVETELDEATFGTLDA